MEKRINHRLPKTVAAFLLGIIMALSVSIGANAVDVDGMRLVPMGNTVGIRMECSGVLVVGLCEVGEGSGFSPAADSGIRPGDIITHINATEVCTAEQLKAEVAANEGKAVSVRLDRGGKEMQFTVEPASGSEGTGLGVMIRDAITGIGTMTFYDPNSGMFAALGHSISDVDTGVLLPLKSGKLMYSEVESVVKGVCGTPGELRGKFDVTKQLGTITANTERGIFGTCEALDIGQAEPMQVAKRSEIKTGHATVLANVNGAEVREFDIEIVRVYPEDGCGRDMMLSVCDEELLDACGGIVQGMSGSPILQNGKLVGAVTHVLVNDPTRGYGISVESMLEAAA